MELYEFSEDKKKILVYELEAIKEEVKKYKEEHLRRRFYDLETVNKDLIDSLLNGDVIDEWSLRSKSKDFHANLITSSSETEYQKVVRDNLLRKYYNSECLGCNITQVCKVNDKLDEFSPYALLPIDNYESVYSHTDDINWYRFPNLLVLHNKDLVGLHLLEQGNYKEIILDNILSKEIPFNLFDLSLKMMLPNKLNDDTIVDILGFDKEEYIFESSKVLTLYRNSIKK